MRRIEANRPSHCLPDDDLLLFEIFATPKVPHFLHVDDQHNLTDVFELTFLLGPWQVETSSVIKNSRYHSRWHNRRWRRFRLVDPVERVSMCIAPSEHVFLRKITTACGKCIQMFRCLTTSRRLETTFALQKGPMNSKHTLPRRTALDLNVRLSKQCVWVCFLFHLSRS